MAIALVSAVMLPLTFSLAKKPPLLEGDFFVNHLYNEWLPLFCGSLDFRPKGRSCQNDRLALQNDIIRPFIA